MQGRQKKEKNELLCTSQEAFEAHAPLDAESRPGHRRAPQEGRSFPGGSRGRGRPRPQSRAGDGSAWKSPGFEGLDKITKCLGI